MTTESLPLERELVMYRGETWRRYAWRYSPSGVPQPFAGWTARMQLRESYDDDAELALAVTVTLGVNPETQADEDGWIVPTATSVQTAAVELGAYKFDLELVADADAPEDVIKFVRGTVRVEGETTR